MILKRGAKLFLSCKGRPFAGPFKWTLVREWIALGLVPRDALVRTAPDEASVRIENIEQLFTCPQGVLDTSAYYQSAGRTRVPSAPRQHSYLVSLGCPFETAHLDKHLTWRVISDLEVAFPERATQDERAACEEEFDRAYREGPATEKQVAYLTSIGVDGASSMSKAEASRLISGPPSEGQLRRLQFYKITVSPRLTKDEASILIETYVRDHPESEAQYQAWKQAKPAEIESGDPLPSLATPEMRAKAEAALRALEATPSVQPPSASAPNKPWWKLW